MDLEKRRVATWKEGVWDYMLEARREYFKKYQAHAKKEIRIAVFSTGVDNDYRLVPEGTPDPYWRLTAGSDPKSVRPKTYAVRSTTAPIPPWLTPSLTSHSLRITPYQVTTQAAAGTYVYEKTFILDDVALDTMALFGRIAGSDSVDRIEINGEDVAQRSAIFIARREFLITDHMVKAGDENFAELGTKGLETIYSTFQKKVLARLMDGTQRFSHIKAWYNLVGWAAWDYGSSWASSEKDVEERGRQRLPSNTECIGVDTYDYWWLNSGFDPAETSNADKVTRRVNEWHRIRTQYYPEGISTYVGRYSKDPSTWTPECWSDTHALLNAIRFAGAETAMVIYIGLSSSLPGHHTTPIETMDAYYENCKAGPSVGLIQWTSMGKVHPDKNPLGTLGYVDRTLVHYTPDTPKGRQYSKEALDRWHDKFMASRRRMFRDVVYGQFRFLKATDPN